jgi:hypothetical protein
MVFGFIHSENNSTQRQIWKYNLYLIGIGLWYLTPLSTMSKLYRGNQLYWRWKSEYPEKTTDLSEVSNKLYHIMLYQEHLAWVGFELTTLVVICTDCTGSCKFNYHTNTNTTAPALISFWHVNCRITCNKLHDIVCMGICTISGSLDFGILVLFTSPWTSLWVFFRHFVNYSLVQYRISHHVLQKKNYQT